MDARYHFRDDTQATGDPQDTKKRDFPILTVLIPISQETEVTKVTELRYLINKINKLKENE